MASTIYLDFVNGSDSNSGLGPLLPKKTYSAAEGVAATGDTILIAKCGTVTTVTPGGGNFTWTVGSATITAPTGHGIVAGDYIGSSTAAGNGSEDGYYTVLSSNATTITLLSKWYGAASNLVEASIKKVVPTNAVISNGKVLNLIGGHTTGASWTRDGETFIQATGAACITASTGTYVSYMNVFPAAGYYGFTSGGIGADIAWCSGAAKNTTTGTYVFNKCYVSLPGVKNFVTSAAVGFNGTYISNGSNFATCCTNGFNACIISGGTNKGHGNYSAGIAAGSISGGTNYCDFNGVGLSYVANITGGTNTAASNTTGFNYGTIAGGTNIATSNGVGVYFTAISSGTVDVTGSTTYGMQSATITGGTSTVSTSGTAGLYTCTLTNVGTVNTTSNPIGVSSFGGGPEQLLYNWNSTNDVIGLQATADRAGVKLVNCTFTTPGTWAISRSLTSGCVTCVGCTIDEASINKAYRVVSGASYVMPQYVMQNSFGKTGLIYANAYVLQNTSTVPYSLDMQFSGTSGLQKTHLSVVKVYTKQGVAQNFSVQYSAPTGTWSGTLVPYLLLNGKIIATGTTITTVDATPRTVAFSPTALDISEDGVLEIAVIPNCNNVIMNWANPAWSKAA